MELLIYIPFIIRNYIRAVAAKLNGMLWAFYTLIAMLVATFVGGMIEGIIMISQDPALARLLAQRNVTQQQMMDYMAKGPIFLPTLFILFCAVGGYLFIRHLLIKRAGGEEPQI